MADRKATSSGNAALIAIFSSFVLAYLAFVQLSVFFLADAVLYCASHMIVLFLLLCSLLDPKCSMNLMHHSLAVQEF